MYKKFFIIAAFNIIAGSAFSQTTPQIEKALNDRNRAENEAKADVYIQRKKMITDSTQTAVNANTKTAAKKKRRCNQKSS